MILVRFAPSAWVSLQQHLTNSSLTAAPFGLLTFSREGAIPTFDLPPVSYFRTSLFGRGPGGNEYVVESSVAGNQNDSSASVLTASVAFAVMMVMILV